MARTKEIWKDVPNYEGFYQISNKGNVWSFYRNEKMKPRINSFGYLRVDLFKDGNYKRFLVHRLVLLTFIGKSKLHVDHINNIRADNRLENLRYCTLVENNTIYRGSSGKSGITNIVYQKNGNKYHFEIILNDRHKGPLRDTIDEVILDYLTFKEAWFIDHPERFINHPIEKLIAKSAFK